MNPAVAGIPASASMEIVIGHASSGRSRPRPAIASIESPQPVSRSRATITANEAAFMAMYTAR